MGRGDQRDELLVKALETAPGSELAIGLAEARMQFDNGQLKPVQTCGLFVNKSQGQRADHAQLSGVSAWAY